MKISRKLSLQIGLIVTVTLLFSGRGLAQDNNNQTTEFKPGQYTTIQWTELVPQEEIDILDNPPTYISDIEDGSTEDQLSSPVTNSIVLEMADRYQQALVSTNIKPEMNGRKVRIPGFIVPLEFDDQQVITEFFLVPYFGACLHMPPPAPNQMIHVKYAKGLEIDALYYPFWVSGVLKTSLVKNDLATAAYALEMASYEAYEQ
ncbi:MAG: DUF3299 domain-containing protein [Porticoccaceae bacterium]|nr:DUF3299 domain-containing protein [Porticoccaceae bacterium]